MTRLVPACFGKLPLHADFIRHGPPAAELDLLDQWIQEGIVGARQLLGSAWEPSFDAAPPLRFLYGCRRTGRVLGGLLAPAHDRAGRRFPFLVYAALDAREAGNDPPLLPIVLGDFLEQAEALASGGWQGLDLKALFERVDRLAFVPDWDGARKRFGEVLGCRADGGFWAERLGPSGDWLKYVLAEDLAQALSTPAVPRYALRFPGSGGGVEMAFWLELCRHFNRRLGVPTLAGWRRVGPGGTVVFDELLPKYFPPVLWPERPSGQSYPLATGGAADRLERARARYAVLGDSSLLVAEVLQRLGR